MSSLRVFLRVPFITLVSLLASGTILMSAALSPFFPATQLLLRNSAFRWWGRQTGRLMGMKVNLEGQPPTGQFFLVANHVSYVDIILLAAYIDCAFVAKADLRGWPLLGWAFDNADTIFVDRGRKRDLLRAMQHVRSRLDRGLGVMIFPEGTSSKGDQVLRLKPSLLEIAAEAGKPVHYATLSYRTRQGAPPAHEAICWWDDTPFVTHLLRLLNLRSFDATLKFGTQPIAANDRKTLAEQLRSAMAEQFTPIL